MGLPFRQEHALPVAPSVSIVHPELVRDRVGGSSRIRDGGQTIRYAAAADKNTARLATVPRSPLSIRVRRSQSSSFCSARGCHTGGGPSDKATASPPNSPGDALEQQPGQPRQNTEVPGDSGPAMNSPLNSRRAVDRAQALTELRAGPAPQRSSSTGSKGPALATNSRRSGGRDGWRRHLPGWSVR